MAIKLIDQLTEPYDPNQYADTYTEELMELIKDKAQGKEREPEEEEEPIPAEVTDLFAKLRESLAAAESRK
jgi:DNA end-binding protein Ku